MVHKQNDTTSDHSADSANEAPRTDPKFHDLRTLPAGVRRGGAHRIPTPPSALKGRAAVVAVAAGAVVAAGQTVSDGTPAPTTSTGAIALAAGTSIALPGGIDTASLGETSNVLTVPDLSGAEEAAEYAQQLAKGAEAEIARIAREALALRPMFVKPTSGTLTSNYGSRWGTIHGGLDIANAMQTPIFAVSDGEVIDSGPASGFGQWVRLKHADGTVSVYGHIDSALVQVGQHVTAGDEIAKMGNRGFSTGPHLHFEIWEHGTDRIDPAPWLAQRGISTADFAG
ncbi:M23 family metallopeptidase [Tomitella biformata]|uniref:M23 family metallopeptidase n=1 Tax=Tomitella biformata TaxID=630403 RepID=UPI000465E264|nr:M23 family metallopeptidase [Tomitella biformata]